VYIDFISIRYGVAVAVGIVRKGIVSVDFIGIDQAVAIWKGRSKSGEGGGLKVWHLVNE